MTQCCDADDDHDGSGVDANDDCVSGVLCRNYDNRTGVNDDDNDGSGLDVDSVNADNDNSSSVDDNDGSEVDMMMVMSLMSTLMMTIAHLLTMMMSIPVVFVSYPV